MIEDKIYISFSDKSLNLKTVEEHIQETDHVEDLVFRILNNEGVKPVYRSLFALRLTHEQIWLAPNVPLKPILNWTRNGQPFEEPKLQLRMRFRPSCFTRLAFVDKVALDIIFAQVRIDFMTSRFNNEKRDFVLLNNAVLGLIVLDLIRHAIEHSIKIDDLLKSVNPQDFLPQRASKWQRAILPHLYGQINLENLLKVGYENCDKDTLKIKQKYIELFLSKVADNYGSETYCVDQIIQSCSDSGKLSTGTKLSYIRVRYYELDEKACCVIETCGDLAESKNSTKSFKNYFPLEKCVTICDIETISHITISQNIVQFASKNGPPNRYQFKSKWHAESFVSSIDGYYRLMKKWNMNICSEVSSPYLKYLKQLGSHGPIGFETTRKKLSKFQGNEQGHFLVRRCMDHSDRFLIDTILRTSIRLTIEVDWYSDQKAFKMTGHSVRRKGLEVSITTNLIYYKYLNDLINDIEIRVRVGPEKTLFVQQLKFWIKPEEDDDYPALLLSMSKKRLDELEHDGETMEKESFDQLPRIIPDQALKYTGERFTGLNNGLIVDLALFNGERNVIVKNLDTRQETGRKLSGSIESYSFHVCSKGHNDLSIAPNSNPIQMRVSEWVFVKSHLFAETIGYLLSGGLVQEYFSHGPLDKFLCENAQVNHVVRLSVSHQLAQALLFLHSKCMIHGKIRCHNVMVRQTNPIHVKLTDPLGSMDTGSDQAFIPSEYFSSNVQTCVRQYHSGIDVWALGTTMWQIFSNGARPPPHRYANTLIQPHACPDNVWSLIEACWIIEPNSRAAPRAIFRDLCDFLAWEKDSHHYFYISPEDSDDCPNSDTLPKTSTRSGSSTNSIDLPSSSSPVSSASGNGSQTNLLPWRAHSSSSSSGASGETTRTIGDSSLASDHLPPIKRSTWKKVINLKRNLKTQQADSLHRSSLGSSLFGSKISLTSCTTPSGSDITRMTLLDFESISDALNRCIWHIDSNRLKLGPEIGRGSCGIVMKGVMSPTDGSGGEQVVAVKCIDKDSTNFCQNHIDDLKREFEILKNLNHENIVKALGYVGESQMMLIFEYMPLGSLLSCVRNIKTVEDLHELPLRKYATDIAKGMEYLESMKIVHRDLALRNILLSSRNEVKICDFGLAKSLGSNEYYRLETERALPLRWYAPETICTRVFTHKSDVWSYGVVLWEIYSGGDSPQYSWAYADLSETLKHERLPVPNKCPRHMYDLMLKCWAYNADDRMSFTQVRQTLENFAMTQRNQ